MYVVYKTRDAITYNYNSIYYGVLLVVLGCVKSELSLC